MDFKRTFAQAQALKGEGKLAESLEAFKRAALILDPQRTGRIGGEVLAICLASMAVLEHKLGQTRNAGRHSSVALRLAKGAGSKALVSKMEKLLATIEEDLAKERAQLQLPKSAEFFDFSQLRLAIRSADREALEGFVSLAEVANDKALTRSLLAVAEGAEQQTIVHACSSSGSHQLLDRLLRMGATLDAADKNGRTALWYAVSSGRSYSAAFLVEHGALVTKAMVDLASSKGNKEMQSILKSGPRKSSESDDAKKGKNKSNSRSNSKKQQQEMQQEMQQEQQQECSMAARIRATRAKPGTTAPKRNNSKRINLINS